LGAPLEAATARYRLGVTGPIRPHRAKSIYTTSPFSTNSIHTDLPPVSRAAARPKDRHSPW
jgi:hypothetical protein